MTRRTIVAALAAAITAVTAAPAAAQTLLQPGAYHETSTGACTLNFVYDGKGGLAGSGTYLGTAAHCAEKKGDVVRDIDGVRFGTIAYIGDADVTAKDFALILVDSEDIPRVRAAVRGYPQYPTGFTTSSETRAGDQIQFSGYGLGFDLTQPTREKRFGLLTFDDSQIWGVAGAMNFGDSGGPLVHIPTGKALGIESRVCIGVCTDEGPTVQGILAKAAAAGFPVALRGA